MAQVNIATIDAMLLAIDNALEGIVPAGGIADAAALTALTGRVSDAETALGARALVSSLAAESQARTDAVSGLQTDVNARIPSVEKGAADGVATLGSDGKILASQLPALATTETFVVASQTEQLALAAQPGDFAVRTDFAPNRNYILTTTDPSNFNNWRQLSAPGAVTSVDGMTGAVTLGSTSVVANTLARRTPTGQLAVAAAQADGEAIERAQFLAELATRDARLATLEADRLFAPLGPFSPPFLNGWSHLAPANWDSVKLDRDARGMCSLAGDMVGTAAIAAGATAIVANLPAKYRPRRTAIRQAGVGGNPQQVIRCEIRLNGDVALIASTTVGVTMGECIALNLSWWSADAQTADTPPTAT